MCYPFQQRSPSAKFTVSNRSLLKLLARDCATCFLGALASGDMLKYPLLEQVSGMYLYMYKFIKFIHLKKKPEIGILPPASASGKWKVPAITPQCQPNSWQASRAVSNFSPQNTSLLQSFISTKGTVFWFPSRKVVGSKRAVLVEIQHHEGFHLIQVLFGEEVELNQVPGKHPNLLGICTLCFFLLGLPWSLFLKWGKG